MYVSLQGISTCTCQITHTCVHTINTNTYNTYTCITKVLSCKNEHLNTDNVKQQHFNNTKATALSFKWEHLLHDMCLHTCTYKSHNIRFLQLSELHTCISIRQSHTKQCTSDYNVLYMYVHTYICTVHIYIHLVKVILFLLHISVNMHICPKIQQK